MFDRKAFMKEYHKTQREKVIAYNKEYYKTHKGELNKRAVKYRKTHTKNYQKICPFCKSPFTAIKRQLYCHPICAQSQRNKEIRSQRIKKAKKVLTKICAFCEEEFRTTNVQRKYCTDNCRAGVQKIGYKKKCLVNYWSVFNRDDFTCQYCGKNPTQDKVKLHIDHIIAKSKNGEDKISNYVTACSLCNSKKGDKELLRKKKFINRLKHRIIIRGGQR